MNSLDLNKNRLNALLSEVLELEQNFINYKVCFPYFNAKYNKYIIT